MKKKKENEILKNNSVKGLFAIGIVVVMMFSLVPLGATATNTINDGTTDSSDFKVTTKAKAATVKVTWNANEGKIGTKKTTTTSVKKGKKIGKLPKTPKLAGYTFKGWYTKKTGGTKITKNTKVKKKVTYYAQWTKVLTAEEQKLVGTYGYTNLASGFLSAWSDGYNLYQQWNRGAGTISTVKFNPDGTYESYSLYISQDRLYICTGNWKISQKVEYLDQLCRRGPNI